LEKPKEDPNKKRVSYAWGIKDVKDLDKGKTLGADTNREIVEKSKKEVAAKIKIADKRMDVRKGRLEVDSPFENDWVISMVVLTNGDILLLQLYDTKLKMMDSLGNMISECTLYGNPWSVGVYNDSLAVVTFTDRKQLQLINVSKSGLIAGKLINTRHRCLAVCFARNLIAATCWEGCVHLLNISGQEVAVIDKNTAGQRLFTNPEFIAADKLGTTLYVTDYKRHSVTGLKLLPNKIDNKPAFVFTHRDLKGPKGVTVDKEGVLYVSGMDNRNIFRISSTGELIQIYRRREDTEYYEAIAVSSTGDKLFVSAYEDNTICVLRLK
jgi:DNA-binding beta-propeller fold protein YncE